MNATSNSMLVKDVCFRISYVQPKLCSILLLRVRSRAICIRAMCSIYPAHFISAAEELFAASD